MAENCFLCEPDPILNVASWQHTFVMVGLGPITSTYCILGAKRHVRSLADLCSKHPEAIAELQQARCAVESIAGPLLMTEHGRVPICRDDGDQHDQHCFHGHALLFATDADISASAARFYRDEMSFTDLNSAMKYATTKEHYLLLSPSASHYLLLSEPLNAPRQLSRTLVAIAEGDDHLADWRSSPRFADAAEMAAQLRGRSSVR